MAATAPPPDESADLSLAPQDAYRAAMGLAPYFQADSGDGEPASSHDAIRAWSLQYVRGTNAPPEVAEDCVKWLRTFHAAAAAENAGAASPSPQWHLGPTSAQLPAAANDSSAANDATAPVSLGPTLDVDHCTIARLMKDEDQLWAAWHDSPFPEQSAGVGGRGGGGGQPWDAARDDLFSEEALQREAWLCWATVLRDVKIEAAVTQQGRLSRRRAADGRSATQATFAGLLDYLEAPETPWLLHDAPSSVLMATDLYMADRAYDPDSSGGDKEGKDAPDGFNGSNVVGRDTHDMQAVHSFLLQQGEMQPPLRSLLSLTLARHISDGVDEE